MICAGVPAEQMTLHNQHVSCLGYKRMGTKCHWSNRWEKEKWWSNCEVWHFFGGGVHTHTHTHTHAGIYIYIPGPSNVLLFDPWSFFFVFDNLFLSKPTIFVGPKNFGHKTSTRGNRLFPTMRSSKMLQGPVRIRLGHVWSCLIPFSLYYRGSTLLGSIFAHIDLL